MNRSAVRKLSEQVLGNLDPLIKRVIYLLQYILWLGINLHTVSSISHWTSWSETSNKVYLRDLLSHSLQFSMLRIREIVARYRINSPDFEFESLTLSLRWRHVWHFRSRQSTERLVRCVTIMNVDVNDFSTFYVVQFWIFIYFTNFNLFISFVMYWTDENVNVDTSLCTSQCLTRKPEWLLQLLLTLSLHRYQWQAYDYWSFFFGGKKVLSIEQK